MTISIITATYNSGTTVRDTFESVLSQIFKNIEYIVIDGGSTDDTLKIIREYESRFEGRMRWISERDRGLYDAMSKGIAMATGDVVGILNSDDFYTAPDVLTSVAATLENKTIDAVYGDIHFVRPDNLSRCVRYYSSNIFRPWLMRLGFIPAHPSFYCRKSLYNRYGTFNIDYKIAADFEILLRLIYVHRIHAKYLKKDFVTMRMGGISTNGMASHRLIMRDQLRALRENGVYSNAAILSLRYIYKICELLNSKLKYFFI